jgi:hypothetical protein
MVAAGGEPTEREYTNIGQAMVAQQARLTVCPLQHIRDEISLMSVVNSSNGKFEFI